MNNDDKQAEPVAFLEWCQVLAEKVDAYITTEYEGDDDESQRVAYDLLKAHILATPFQTSAAPAVQLMENYATEINRLRNVIQAACSGGLDHMIERWKVLFPDAPVPTVKAAPAVPQWQPIETAPKSKYLSGGRIEGVYLLGYCPDPDTVCMESAICVVWWEPLLNDGHGHWQGEGNYPLNPTHWAPLPAAPQQNQDSSL